MGYIVARNQETQLHLDGVADGLQSEIERDFEELELKIENFVVLSDELVQLTKTLFPTETLLYAGKVESGVLDGGT